MATTKSLQDMFINELRDIYSAETQIVRNMPKLIRAAASPDLKKTLENHLEETRGQVERLDQVFQNLDKPAKARGKKCEAMEGLLTEAQEIMEMGLSPEAQDSALIAAAQKVEHYEIASYGTAIAWAKAMNHKEVVDILNETLQEEKNADNLLNKVSGGVNTLAAKEAHPG